MQGRYLRHPFPYLSIYPVVGVSLNRYWRYPSDSAVGCERAKKIAKTDPVWKGHHGEAVTTPYGAGV